MKIGVDIRALMDKHYSGVSEYTANLLSAILRQNAARTKPDDYYLYYNSFHDLSARLNEWNSAQSRMVATRWPNKIFNYLLQKFCAWPKLDRVLGGVDVFWSPHFNFTRLSAGPGAAKRIITVHDLSFLRYPEFFSVRKSFWHRALGVKKMLKAADKIVAVSENTKNDIVELTGIDPEKIFVVYPGNNAKVSVNKTTEEDAKEFLIKHNLLEPFILYLGTIEPRKNVDGLIVAYNQLRDKLHFVPDGSLKNLKLVVAGAPGWKNRKVYRTWRRSSYKNDIIFLGYISQKEKEILLRRTLLLVYPSFYEGFGFPPLEAMTYGTPVVCSNVSSLPEVVGNAALMINPFKIREITDGLYLILTDQELRARLIACGYERAKLFSWDKTAATYLKLFAELNEKV